MEASLVHNLKKLSIDDSQTLFERRAFAEGGAVKTEDLVAIGKVIVKRCDGLPLAIEVLGKLLWSKGSKDEWVEVEKNSMWGSIKDVDDLAVKVIRLSYDHLSPTSLKHCFSFCSIFPKDSNIWKDTLVQFWMALGLLPVGRHEEVEDVGSRYFDKLLGKSLLQEPTLDDFGNIRFCKMHDLVHDIALEESKDYCLALTEHSDQGYDFSDDILHLSLSFPTREMMSKVCSLRLQTLILEGFKNLDDMLENFEFKFLRVLVLNDWEMVKLPKWVGKMKHLRYLDISRTHIKKFPTSLTKLYNLQTLKVGYDIPRKFGNLVNLRHNLRHVCGGVAWVGVGKLTSLRTLSLFEVSRDEGHLIQELGELNNLTGELEIIGLHNVSSLEEAQRAKLFEKSKLQSLDLIWGGSDSFNGHEEDTLEGLRPHPSLKGLEIRNFMGKKLSSWLTTESVSTLQNLVSISLYDCHRCEQVPTLGCLPHLRNLRLDRLINVRKIGVEFYHDSVIQNGERIVFFPALETLKIWSLTKLVEWVDVKEVYGPFGVTISLFPKLMELEINNCPSLVGFPNILHDCAALNTLTILECDNLETIPDLSHLTMLQPTGMHLGRNVLKMCEGMRQFSVPYNVTSYQD